MTEILELVENGKLKIEMFTQENDIKFITFSTNSIHLY